MVYYIPRGDADLDLYERTDHHTHCPFKGDASYFSLPGARGAQCRLDYEDPCPAVAAIKDHLAFYPDRVDFDRSKLGAIDCQRDECDPLAM